MLQKNHEMDLEISVIFATHGCPNQFRIFKKDISQTKIKMTKAMLSSS
jgi:hypothetical protein